jgi:DNA-binding LytR/AlgR family response regulator
MNHTTNKQALHLLLPTDRGVEIIDTKTLVRVEAISNYSKLYFANGKTLVVAKVLRWFEEQLDAAMFLRTHRTHLINKQFVHRYHHGQTAVVKLINGESIGVSKRKKKYFLQLMGAVA